jgi:hypothetical protein
MNGGRKADPTARVPVAKRHPSISWKIQEIGSQLLGKEIHNVEADVILIITFSGPCTELRLTEDAAEGAVALRVGAHAESD